DSRNVQANADAVIRVVLRRLKLERFIIHVSHVIEQREAESFNNRDAVFHASQIIGVAADGLAADTANAAFLRRNIAIAKTAQRISAAQKIALEERYVVGRQIFDGLDGGLTRNRI